MSRPSEAQELPDFSLVSGGPLYRLLSRAGLVRPPVERIAPLVVAVAAITWLPLLVLSALEGNLAGAGISFLRDVEAHVEYLVVLPVLVGAERLIHLRLRPVVEQFIGRGIVAPDDRPAFAAAVRSALRLRDSTAVEMLMLAVVFTVGQWVWRNEVALAGSSWHRVVGDSGPHTTLAGHWYALVSIPAGQFIVLRWYFRLFVWSRFLWQVSRLELRLTPMHPDRAGRLGFIGYGADAFSPFLFGQGALLSALIASRVLHEGRKLLDFKFEVVGFVLLFLLVILGPLATFAPKLIRAQRRGRHEYGLLASRYVQAFHEKWVERAPGPAGELLGTPDLQSLADLDGAYAPIREMRMVPFGRDVVIRLALFTTLPLLPLVFTVVSLEELLRRMISTVF
jgi:hypothetical protein